MFSIMDMSVILGTSETVVPYNQQSTAVFGASWTQPPYK